MRPILFTDLGCPYAHRVLALLAHLDVEVDLREAPPHQRPPGLARYSPSARVPLLVHEDLVIGESTVMLEYLAEAFELPDALPADLRARTRHRHAMALADEVLTPLVFRPDDAVRRGRLEECLAILEALTAATPPGPTLLALHLAPVWRRFSAWRPESAATRALRGHPALVEWLEAAAAIDAVARTERGTDPAFVAAIANLVA